MATQVASLFGVLSLRDEQFRRGMQDARGNMRDLSQNLQDLGGRVQGMGQQMTLMTAPLAAAMGVGINNSRNFSRAMSNVNSILGISGEEAEALRTQILEFGGDSIYGPQATAEAFYRVVSAVQDTSSHMAILEQGTRTAAAGQADLEATTGALISTMNAYGLQAEDAAWVSDVFSQTVAKGDTNMNDLARSMPQVTGLASQFGIGVDELGGNLAYMTGQGFAASESATMMRSMISTLLAPTADVASVIQELGFESGQALLEGEGLVGAYELLAGQAGSLAGLITNQEALTGGLLLTKEGADEFFATYMEGIDGATERQAEIQGQTEGWDRLRSKLQEVSIMAGDRLEPHLNRLFDETIIPGIDTVLDWADENENAANTILMVAAGAVAAGPVLLVLGTIIKGVGMIVGVATTAVGLLKGAFALLLSPVGAGIALGVVLYTVLNDLLEPFGGLKGVVDDAWTTLQQLGLIITFHVLNAIDNLKNKINELLGPASWIAGAFRDAKQAVEDFLGVSSQAVGVNPSYTVQNPQSALMDPFGEMRAAGGPVTGGMPYVVGERGPELFVPASSGNIVPNYALAGAGGMSFEGAVFNIHANDYEGGRAAGRGFRDELDMLMNEAG